MQAETLSNQYGNIKWLLKEDLKYLYANMQGHHIYNTKVNTKVALFWAVWPSHSKQMHHIFQNIHSIYWLYHTDMKNKHLYSVYQKHFFVNVVSNLIKMKFSEVERFSSKCTI